MKEKMKYIDEFAKNFLIVGIGMWGIYLSLCFLAWRFPLGVFYWYDSMYYDKAFDIIRYFLVFQFLIAFALTQLKSVSEK